MNMTPFRPVTGANTVQIDVAATTASVALGGIAGYQQVRVMNNGTATAWISFGSSTVEAAAATAIPLAPGSTEVFSTNATYVAAIAAAATGIIYFTPGSGI